jgi:hypothetical protein
MLEIILIILGLVVFETISSVDNAIVNADVIKTLPAKQRRFFLTWGLFIAVFAVRGILPFLIVWIANPALNAFQVVGAAFSNDPQILAYVEQSKPALLLGGGVYLALVFMSWLFTEHKNYAFNLERFIHKQSVWFFAVASLFLLTVVWLGTKIDPALALAATIGSTAFFITDGFRRNAEEAEKNIANSSMSAWSKVVFLEVLDASFSIDGVIGAFAFTVSIPLILIGNGIGAYVVREITIRGVDTVSKFEYLKNGAMYSIGVLGFVMVTEALGSHHPYWFAPLSTFAILGLFLWLSRRETMRKLRAIA